jgi:hypothetical protein
MDQLGESEAGSYSQGQGRYGLAFGETRKVIEHIGNVGSGNVVCEVVQTISSLIAVAAKLRKIIKAGAEFTRRRCKFDDTVGSGKLAAVGKRRSE